MQLDEAREILAGVVEDFIRDYYYSIKALSVEESDTLVKFFKENVSK